MTQEVTATGSETEDVQVEDLAQETPEEAVKEPVVDWQAKFEAEAQARQDSDSLLKKREQDWRSQKNELLIKKTTDDTIAKIADAVGVDKSTIETSVKGVLEEQETQRVQEAHADEVDDIVRSLRQIAQEGGIDLKSDDAKLADRLWKYGKSLYDNGQVAEALLEFHEAEEEIKATVERVKQRTEREAAITKEQDDKREEVDSGAVDLNGPRAQRGAGSGASWAQAQRITNVKDLSDAAYEELVAGK